LKAVDQDRSGSIEFSEFLAHSLTAEHLSEKNIRLFFDTMLPPEGQLATQASLQSGGGQSPKAKGENEEQGNGRKDEEEPYIDAKVLHQFFKKCGKQIKRRELKKLMTQCGQQLGLEGFSGKAKIKP
jgi:hypothetical protein